MTEHVFFFMSSPVHLLEKIIFERQNISLENIEKENYYSIFNLIFSINHLYDWVLLNKLIDETIRIMCIKNFNPYKPEENVNSNFKSLYNKIGYFPQTNIKQKVIRDLCNNTKHFKIEKDNKIMTETNVERISCCGNIYAGDDDALADNYKYKFTISDALTQVPINLIELCDFLIYEWDSFIKQNLILE